MIIKSLSLKEGLQESYDVFSSKNNLIYSVTNTKGKSTYMRLLFFALGYPIPNMKGIDFQKIYTEICLEEKEKSFLIKRDKNLLSVTTENNTINFTLPSEHAAFLGYILQYNNIKVLNNLLGILYIDQDRGWSLLNRGSVIGKIKFNIEELLSGLNNVDIDSLLAKKSQLTLDKNKYLAMRNISVLSEQVYEQNGELFLSDLEKELLESISLCKLKIQNLKESLAEIISVINGEKNFYNFIDSMMLSVQQGDIIIPVNRDTIVYSKINHEYLNVRKSIIASDIEKIKKEKAVFESKLSDYKLKNDQISLFTQNTDDEIINKQLAHFNNIDQKVVENLLDKTQKDLSTVNAEIKQTLKENNDFIKKIYDYVFSFAQELRVDDKMVLKNDFIFTSDLKSMSGAVLQKMVFVFKLAFLKVIEEDIGTKLFMVLDSPKGKELDDENTSRLINLVNKELKDNQVFIASIFDFDVDKKIEIVNYAIEKRK